MTHLTLAKIIFGWHEPEDDKLVHVAQGAMVSFTGAIDSMIAFCGHCDLQTGWWLWDYETSKFYPTDVDRYTVPTDMFRKYRKLMLDNIPNIKGEGIDLADGMFLHELDDDVYRLVRVQKME